MNRAAFILVLTFFSLSVYAKNIIVKDSSFVNTRDHFLRSLETKDLNALMMAVDDSVAMIFPDGDIMRSKNKYYEFNQGWFKKPWKITTEVLTTDEKSDLGYSLIKYKYIRYNPDGTEKTTTSIYLILIFKKKNDQWLLVHNQHTKILL